MKNVMCFGDSNTYGYDPAGMRDGTAVRYAQDVRWCGVAQRDLGEGWHVIEEGLNGRTTVRDDMCHLDPTSTAFARFRCCSRPISRWMRS